MSALSWVAADMQMAAVSRDPEVRFWCQVFEMITDLDGGPGPNRFVMSLTGGRDHGLAWRVREHVKAYARHAKVLLFFDLVGVS